MIEKTKSGQGLKQTSNSIERSNANRHTSPPPSDLPPSLSRHPPRSLAPLPPSLPPPALFPSLPPAPLPSSLQQQQQLEKLTFYLFQAVGLLDRRPDLIDPRHGYKVRQFKGRLLYSSLPLKVLALLTPVSRDRHGIGVGRHGRDKKKRHGTGGERPGGGRREGEWAHRDAWGRSAVGARVRAWRRRFKAPRKRSYARTYDLFKAPRKRSYVRAYLVRSIWLKKNTQ